MLLPELGTDFFQKLITKFLIFGQMAIFKMAIIWNIAQPIKPVDESVESVNNL